MKRKELEKGDLFNYLTVIDPNDTSYIQPSGQTARAITCKCKCGKIKKYRMHHVTNGRIKSCGCIKSVYGKKSNDEEKYIRKTYLSMLRRCSNKNIESHLYFDRSIKVCDEWKNDFMSFYNWAIKNRLRKGKQIDRIDNKSGYSPNNCRVVFPSINSYNKRTTFKAFYKGKKRPLGLLLKVLGKQKHTTTIIHRIQRGWEDEKAIIYPIRKGNYK